MQPEDLRDMLERLDAIDETTEEIRKLNDEKSKLPKKPPEFFGKFGCFGASGLCAVLGLGALVLAHYSSDWLWNLALSSFLIAVIFLVGGLILLREKNQYEDGLIRLEQIEQSLTERGEERSQLQEINSKAFRLRGIPARYQSREALRAFEGYCYIDRDMELSDMFARFENETNVRKITKMICSIDGRMQKLEQDNQYITSLLGAILSVSKDIDANLDSIRKNTVIS